MNLTVVPVDQLIIILLIQSQTKIKQNVKMGASQESPIQPSARLADALRQI